MAPATGRNQRWPSAPAGAAARRGFRRPSRGAFAFFPGFRWLAPPANPHISHFRVGAAQRVSGERARLACWRRRPAFANFLHASAQNAFTPSGATRQGSSFWRDARTSTRDARAPRGSATARLSYRECEICGLLPSDHPPGGSARRDARPRWRPPGLRPPLFAHSASECRGRATSGATAPAVGFSRLNTFAFGTFCEERRQRSRIHRALMNLRLLCDHEFDHLVPRPPDGDFVPAPRWRGHWARPFGTFRASALRLFREAAGDHPRSGEADAESRAGR